MLAGDKVDIVGLLRADKAGMAVSQLLGPILVDLLHAAGVDSPAHGLAAAKPTSVIAHAVIDHLRMELEQIEIQQRHAVLAADHLGLDAVAGPAQ